MKSGDRFNASNDPTVQYLWNAHKKFMCGRSFEVVNRDLYPKYKESLSNEVKWDIVIANIPLIFELVHSKWDNRFDYSDLLQEGLLGASLGVEKYREGAGSTLVTIIRIYTFKKVQEYIDKFFHRAVRYPSDTIKEINRARKGASDFTDAEVWPILAYSSTVMDVGSLEDIQDNDRRSTKKVLDFIDTNFDHKTQDVFYAHFQIPKQGKGKRQRKETFQQACRQYNLTLEEGTELALITHSTIKKHYNGIHENSI